jgi:hypothetical protein
MSHSLINADRRTHLKIVTVAIVCAVTVVAVGVTARVSQPDAASGRTFAHGPVLKVGKAVISATSRAPIIR